MSLSSKIKQFLFPDEWERNKLITLIIYQFFTEFSEGDTYVLDTRKLDNIQFIDILTKVGKKDKKLIIKIICRRPGLIIGKGGSTFNLLKKEIQSHYNLPIEILIDECTLFNWNKGYENTKTNYSFLMEIKNKNHEKKVK